MSVTTTVGRQATTPTRPAVTTGRLTGAGGLTFAAVLIAQNAIRAGGPGLDASPAHVTAYFLDHRAAALVPLALFPLAMFALFAFVAGLWIRADQPPSRWWASLGALGAATIAAVFSIVNISEIVLAAKTRQLAGAPDVVAALWAVRGAAFGLDLAAIAVALIGLSRAAASQSLIPAWIAVAALPAGACLLTASVFTVALTNGGPWLALALVGFIVWIAFIVAASISLLRHQDCS
jgi:hypothetical protein